MDEQRFDLLTRAIASSTSRRQALALLLAAGPIAYRPRRLRAAQGDEPACDAGLTYCAEASACVDLQSDLNNCGACGSICESGLVTVDCRGGECVRADCLVGLEYCGAVDLCRDLAVDPAHCGACANACASGVCTDGVCATDSGTGCAPGQVSCDGECVDTCCNNQHCGACGNVCPGGETCFEGLCGCPSGLCCAEGETICNGACVATCCDNANCGGCGNVCGNGLTCFEGKCDCPSGLCAPLKLPNTGAGAIGDPARTPPWAALAAAGAAAVAASGWNRSGPRSDEEAGSNG